MTHLAPPAPTIHRRALFVRSWWPVPIMVALGLGAQEVLLDSRYHVGGHAAGHLGSASAPFVALPLIGIILWATPQARRQVTVLIAATAWFAATVVVLVGNLRVVDQLVAAGHARTPTESVPDVADHGVANVAPWYGVAAAVVLIATLNRRRHLGDRTTVATIVVTLLVPPWLFPGAGLFVVALVRCVARRRELRADRRAKLSP